VNSLWKYLAGTPDHNDFIKEQNKINDLIENIKKQFGFDNPNSSKIKNLFLEI